MKWRKAPEELKTLLEVAMQDVAAEKRLMFGYPAYFLNRNLFIGLYQDQLFMRLPAATVSALGKKAGAAVRNLEPMPGRPMKDYFVIAREIYMDRPQLRKLITASLEHTKTLKPKAPRKSPSPKKGGPRPAKA